MVETTSMKWAQQFLLCPRPLNTIEKKSNLRGLGIGYTYIKLSAMIITVNDLVVCAVAVLSKTYIYFVKDTPKAFFLILNNFEIFSIEKV